jgi:hypothetical protein
MNQERIFWFGVTVVIAVVGLCAAVIFIPIAETGEKYADMTIPFILGSGFGSIISVYFGTSEGSKTKTNTIAALVEKQVAEVPKVP